LLSTHYRNPINFTLDAIVEADRRVDFFYEAISKAQGYLAQKKFAGEGKLQGKPTAAFREALEDDLNTADALAQLLALYSQVNARIDAKAPPQEVADLLATAQSLSQVIGLSWRPPLETVLARRALAAARKGIDPAWVDERIAARLLARKEKRFGDADAIRAEVSARGVELRDSAAGTDWRVPA
jgi:cysteinyl-tRNA synthetase